MIPTSCNCPQVHTVRLPKWTETGNLDAEQRRISKQFFSVPSCLQWTVTPITGGLESEVEMSLDSDRFKTPTPLTQFVDGPDLSILNPWSQGLTPRVFACYHPNTTCSPYRVNPPRGSSEKCRCLFIWQISLLKPSDDNGQTTSSHHVVSRL